MSSYDLVVIGCSWGGLDALTLLIKALPSDFEVPILIVQHRGADTETRLSDLLQSDTHLTLGEAEDKEPITPGHVYIAPANYHVLIDDGHFALSTEAPVRFSRPSIDVTLASAAHAYGPKVVAAVLTGANEDGARGLQCIVEYGGHAIVQDPATAEMGTMPAAALRRVPQAVKLPLTAMAAYLGDLARGAVPPARRRASA